MDNVVNIMECVPVRWERKRNHVGMLRWRDLAENCSTIG